MIGKGIEEGIEHYKKIKKGNAGGYDLSSSSLELLGERLLLLQKYAEASAVFQLAVEQYPEYVYGYFYLGRVYEKWGKTKEAIAAYQKAADKGNGSRASIDAVFQIKYLSGRE